MYIQEQQVDTFGLDDFHRRPRILRLETAMSERLDHVNDHIPNHLVVFY
jgi:hypothetical protein